MKCYYKVFLVFLFLIIPFQSVLASSDLVIDCPSGGAIGSVIECNLFSNSDIEISAVRTNLQVSSSLEFVNFKTDSSWQGDGSNGEISLYTYPNKIGNFKLGVVSLKIKSNRTERVGTLSFRDVYFYKADFNRVSGKDISCNIKILSTNHDLASLSLVGYSMTPQFDKNVMEYRAVVDSDVVVIEASGEDEFATVSGTGRKELNYGENVFKIVVTSESGSKKEYQVIVTRPTPPQEENSSNENNHTNQELEKDKENTDKKENENLPQGKDSNSKLQSLGVDGYEIDFHPNRYRYDIEVSSEVANLLIKTVPSSDKASVKIEGNEQLVIGVNEVIITVVAEDGSQSSYTIYVTKKSDVCVISSIKIANYDLKFDCNNYEYELKIGDDDSLDIEVIPSNDKANVQILDNDHLENGDVITILVQDNGVSYQYHIKVLKSGFEIQNIVNSKQLIFVIFVVIFTLLYFVGRFLVKRKMLSHQEQKK